MNVNLAVLVVLCILALYGLIVLIRKMMSTDKDKKWFSEQYRGNRYVGECTSNCGASWD